VSGRLAGRTAVVTERGRGIGRAIVEPFLDGVRPARSVTFLPRMPSSSRLLIISMTQHMSDSGPGTQLHTLARR
jgi:NAD(P)-dependent dehydrogenase (short-subunit alcohol dehydrogenase family)